MADEQVIGTLVWMLLKSGFFLTIVPIELGFVLLIGFACEASWLKKLRSWWFILRLLYGSSLAAVVFLQLLGTAMRIEGIVVLVWVARPIAQLLRLVLQLFVVPASYIIVMVVLATLSAHA